MLQSVIEPPKTSDQPQNGWPLIIFLHGIGERGTDLQKLKKFGVLSYLDAGGELGAYAAAPQCPDTLYWNHVISELNHWLDGVLAEHPIDPDRVILTGYSIGGFGVCEWAYHNPERFAAIVPVAGTVVPSGKQNPCALSHLPMWVLAGVQDVLIPVEGIEAFIHLMKSCDGEPKYTRYPDADHAMTALLAYSDTSLYDWMLSQSRSKHEDK